MHRSGGSHTWPQPHPNLPQGTTHPNLPQGKELVTPTKWCQPTAEIVVQGNLHLPYGGEREGAEVIGRVICRDRRKEYWHHPPPSLPRRGGTDTIGRLTVIGLSLTRVICIVPKWK